MPKHEYVCCECGNVMLQPGPCHTSEWCYHNAKIIRKDSWERECIEAGLAFLRAVAEAKTEATHA